MKFFKLTISFSLSSKTLKNTSISKDFRSSPKNSDKTFSTGSIPTMIELKSKKRIEVEKFAEIFSGWYNFTMIMEQNDIMCIWIEDITAEKIIIDISQKIIDSNTIDYHELAESARRIADAKYCLMNVFSKDEEYFKTVAAAGKRKDLSTATKILGINPEKKVWKSDCHFLNKLRLSHISQFKRVSDFMGDSIPNKLLNTLMSALNIGDFYLCRIQKDNKFVGVFTLVAQKGKSIKNKKQINHLLTASRLIPLKKQDYRERNILKIKKKRKHPLFLSGGGGGN